MRTILLAATATAEFLKGATHVQLAGCNADCGRLEVKLHNEDAWRAVTSSNWTRADASKTCARLGFEDVASISSPFAAAGATGDRAVLGFDGSVRSCVGGECTMPAVGVACRRHCALAADGHGRRHGPRRRLGAFETRAPAGGAASRWWRQCDSVGVDCFNR